MHEACQVIPRARPSEMYREKITGRVEESWHNISIGQCQRNAKSHGVLKNLRLSGRA